MLQRSLKNAVACGAAFAILTSVLLALRGTAVAEPVAPTQSLAENASAGTPAGLAGDVAKRPAWTTSRVVGSPEPPMPFVTERVFPALKFAGPVDLVPIPGSERLMMMEHMGKIFSFPNRQDVAEADLIVDLTKAIPTLHQLYALVFHPDFVKNRYCYVCYLKKQNTQDGAHIARFLVSNTEPPTIDLASETTILTWFCGGHNGCSLKFGPDGCLYISTGDGAPPVPPDGMLKTGQDISDLPSSILRIDVDHPEKDRNYRIPADNPFVDLPGARGEVWAYGFRNPWRMDFDRKTGELWVGDVGWELYEMVNRVERGGNYGWSVMEGRQSTNVEWPRGPTPILPPTIDHPHSESSSVTYGLAYYGTRLPELAGRHVYADYDTGKFWSFRWDAGQESNGQGDKGQVMEHREIADTTLRPSSFATMPGGEFYVLDYSGGGIHQLIPNPQRNDTSAFPRRLSETGLFAAVAEQTPAAGVVPYAVNAEVWADHATAARFAAVPNELTIGSGGTPYAFPKDTVLAKTLSLEMERGKVESRRKLETQILHFDGTEWQPYTYQWNDEQTDATLVGAAGAERTLQVVDPEAPGGKRSQTWRFAGRAECQRCHNKWAGGALAFNTPQLNVLRAGAGVEAGANPSQLEELATMKLLDKAPPLEKRPRVTPPQDASASLDDRARGWLHANCGHCHRENAGSATLSKLHIEVPLEKAELVGVRPTQGTFAIQGAQLIAPGDPCRSVLLYRIAKLGGGRMPHIGSSEVDRAGVSLIEQWLKQLPKPGADDSTAGKAAEKLRADEIAELQQLATAAATAQQTELVDHLLSTTSGALLLQRAVDRRELPAPVVALAVERATRHVDPAVRDLFEMFLPAEQRIKRLGSVVQPQQILSLAGDAGRGRKLFLETAGVSCRNCHRVQQEGKEVGPDLTLVGKKLTRAQILESMLEPSKLIEPKFVTHIVETNEGKLVTGLLVKRDEQEVVLKDAEGKTVAIPASNVEQVLPQQQSLMPDLLLRDLTAQQVADLLEFLGTLR